MSASLVAARGNTIFPIETFGDTLIVLPKGDKAGFGEADFRVECGRVSAALRDPLYRNLVLDFSLTNYVGGSVVEELQKWVEQVRQQGGRAVACEVSDDMQKGLEVSRRAGDWEFFETRSDALKTVARETPGQMATRCAPGIAIAATVLALIGLGFWMWDSRAAERRHFAEMEEIWKDYGQMQRRYPDPLDWPAQTEPLIKRLDGEIEGLTTLSPNLYPTRRVQLEFARTRLRPILVAPKASDPRKHSVDVGLAFIRAKLETADPAIRKQLADEFAATIPGQAQPPQTEEQRLAEAQAEEEERKRLEAEAARVAASAEGTASDDPAPPVPDPDAGPDAGPVDPPAPFDAPPQTPPQTPPDETAQPVPTIDPEEIEASPAPNGTATPIASGQSPD